MIFRTSDKTPPPPPPRHDVAQAAESARKLLHRRALVGAAASSLPIPGLDWLVDAALLARLLPRINREFGLTPEQLDRLDPGKREQVQKAVAMVGSVLIGKLITRDMVVRLARAAGMRMTATQAAKYVPLAGQAAAAALGYATLRYLGERHIQDCIRVVEQAELDIPSHLPTQLERTARKVEQTGKQLHEHGKSKGEGEGQPGAEPSGKRPRFWRQPDRGPWGRSQ
ncbi:MULTISPECIES: hypothetical protein [Delftia]|uniref:DUF697 domain-containing protein n=1 Tax=Delftia lacustris TaxID=558537 RepID=A0A7T2YUM9_9BURK|nr:MULTISPECIES: hypothetical protein [Delftia]EPD45220.1 hypothetical protein HMPREF9702_01565 [Delftia acidovorans CCUG 15835]QPS82314.1 hypothetical protein I6G47_04295 [Delftia lacustris]